MKPNDSTEKTGAGTVTVLGAAHPNDRAVVIGLSAVGLAAIMVCLDILFLISFSDKPCLWESRN